MGFSINSLSPSFAEKVVKDFSGPAGSGAPFLDSFNKKFPVTPDNLKKVYENGLQGLDSIESIGNLTQSQTPPQAEPAYTWSFITAPEDVSWDIANQATRVDIFGTNNPPVVAGSRGMRDLTLGNALVEGFSRGISIEGKIAALEQLMNYSLNSSDGYVSVPVYRVKVQDKQYAGDKGFFIIKDVKVKETMRDLSGNATRAYVDISLMQVPAYQVNTGVDQASQTTAGGVAIEAVNNVKDQANQQMQGKGGSTGGNSKPGNGPEAGNAKPAAADANSQTQGRLPNQESTIRAAPQQ
jgi:hypothetical protein